MIGAGKLAPYFFYMLQVLNRRAHTHANHCEDSYFVHEDDDKIVGAVLDGCSTGYNSHWASQFVAYSFERLCKDSHGFRYFSHPVSSWPLFETNIFRSVGNDIRMGMEMMSLSDMNFLSTIVFFVYLKSDRLLHVRFIGDGCAVVNGRYYRNDENNMPQYLAYFVGLSDDEFERFVSSRRVEVFEGVDNFAICSDGIDSFVNLKNGHLDRSIPIRFLVEDPRSINLKNGLAKKMNILTNTSEALKLDDEHCWWQIHDDLTIIRYANI